MTNAAANLGLMMEIQRSPLRHGLMVALAASWVLVFGIIGSARASQVEPEDVSAIRAVIESQIDAFKRDDAETAFALVSPEVQEMFRAPDIFLEMLKIGYPSLFKPGSYFFGAPLLEDGSAVQPMRIIGSSGTSIQAIYLLERQPDTSWKIGGVVLQEDDGLHV